MLGTILLFPFWVACWLLTSILTGTSLLECAYVYYNIVPTTKLFLASFWFWYHVADIFYKLSCVALYVLTFPLRFIWWHVVFLFGYLELHADWIVFYFNTILYWFHFTFFWYWVVIFYIFVHEPERNKTLCQFKKDLDEAKARAEDLRPPPPLPPRVIGGSGDCWRMLFPNVMRDSHMPVSEFLKMYTKFHKDNADYPVRLRLVVQDDGDLHLDDVLIPTLDRQSYISLKVRKSLPLSPFVPGADHVSPEGSIIGEEVIEFLGRYVDKVVGADVEQAYLEAVKARDRAESLYMEALRNSTDLGTNSRNVSEMVQSAYRNFSLIKRAKSHMRIPNGSNVHIPFAPDNSKKPTLSISSAMASARILIGSDGLQGEYNENREAAFDTLDGHSVNTGVPISSPLYKQLVGLLGIPLKYIPGMDGHSAAATCRRAWMSHMKKATAYGRVGMISPSLVEWHSNPDGFGYYLNIDDGVDRARVNKPCAMCKTKRCKMYLTAKNQGRIATGNVANAISLFKKAEVDYLWMVNIEPNMNATLILDLMRRANIENGFSCFHVNWDVMHTDDVTCRITGQNTRMVGDKVISKFSDSGSYVQTFRDVKAMFSPTFSHGCALRRTVLGRAGTSVLTELNVDHGGYGTNFVPDRGDYYLIPVPHPTKGLLYLKVEREGFDRVLQVFRTTVNRNVEAAKTQLRQANVTYSVAGVQLTPRLKLTASNYELLAVWMVAYSEIMDVVASQGLKEQKVDLESARSKLEYGSFAWLSDTVSRKILSHSNERNPQLGSQNGVKRWLQSCSANGQFLTLEDISEAAYAKVYGESFAVSTSVNWLNATYGSLLGRIPSLKQSLESLKSVSFGTWRAGFTALDAVMTAIIMAGMCTKETAGFIMDVSFHCARIVGIDEDPIRRTRLYLDTLDIPVASVWREVIEAQNLDFQAASVKIVEALMNNFSPDTSVLAELELRYTNESLNMEESELDAKRRALRTTMADIPYVRFMTELKSFFGSINSRAARISQMSSLLSTAHAAKVNVSPEALAHIENLERDAQKMLSELPTVVPLGRDASVWAVNGSMPIMQILPTPVIKCYSDGSDTFKTAEEAFKAFDIVTVDDIKANQRLIKRLPVVDGCVSFAEIHDIMDNYLPGYSSKVEDVEVLPPIPPNAMCKYSPDEKGSDFINNIVSSLAISTQRDQTKLRKPFVTNSQLMNWIGKDFELEAVNKIMSGQMDKIHNEPIPYIAHIDGLAFGGKSKGVRSWITSQDLVVVPSNKLKGDWIKELGELDPFQRASVATQHKALTMDCSRFVIVDEAYTFGLSHLELLRRFPSAKGLITIGDGHQIGAVFEEEDASLNPMSFRPGFIAIAPVSFAPFTSLLEYLRVNRSPVPCDMYYSGSSKCHGLFYTIEQDDVVSVGKNDLCINGTQKAKALMIGRGNDDALTAHESQGARSKWTFVHTTLGGGACPDMAFLKASGAHLGVAVTRSSEGTCFVFKDKRSLMDGPMVDQSLVNGTSELPSDFLYSSPTWDLVDPTVVDTILYERFENENVVLEDSEVYHPETGFTMGSLVDEEQQEAIPLEAITSTEVDATKCKLVNTHHGHSPVSSEETFIFNPARVKGSDKINMLERHTSPTVITAKDMSSARKIIRLLFDRVIDAKRFNALIGEDLSAMRRQSRDQVIKMTEGEQRTKSDTVSFAFAKNEPSKKVMTIGKGLKILSVTAMNATQLALFGDCSNVLTHAWSRSLRPGIITPVGFTKPEVARVLGSMGETYELDIDKQDSSHSSVHVAVFVRLVEMVAKRQGMSDLAQEIRCWRTIGDMEGNLRIEMGSGLGSGDAWTLIANMIMAFSMLISRYEIPYGIRMLQVGDDITCDRKLRKRKDVIYGSDHVGLKELVVTTHSGRPSFTSNVSINSEVSIAARIRGIIKMAYSRRTRTQHIAYGVECKQLNGVTAVLGLPAHAKAYADLFNADPMGVEYIINRACTLAAMQYDDLPESLKSPGHESKCTLHSKDGGCLGYALAFCVGNNVQAVNAMSTYNYPATMNQSVEACRKNKVDYTVMQGQWSNRSSPEVVINDYLTRAKSSPMMYLFSNHAVSVTSESSEIVTFSGTVRYKVDLMSEEVTEIDYF